MAANGENFSKSKGNGVDPLEIIAQGYGADALRTYLMFAAPLDLWVRWDPRGVPGTFRFLSRVWNLTLEFLEAEPTKGNNEAVTRAINKTIKKVSQDLEDQKYNTAIAVMMQCTNTLYTQKGEHGFVGETAWQYALESLVQLVAPFAPHMAEELWHLLGHDTSVNVGHWPQWDDKMVIDETITIGVQVNGKLRAQISLSADASEEQAIATAKADDKIVKLIDGKKIKKEIYIPGRLVSLVVVE